MGTTELIGDFLEADLIDLHVTVVKDSDGKRIGSSGGDGHYGEGITHFVGSITKARVADRETAIRVMLEKLKYALLYSERFSFYGGDVPPAEYFTADSFDFGKIIFEENSQDYSAHATYHICRLNLLFWPGEDGVDRGCGDIVRSHYFEIEKDEFIQAAGRILFVESEKCWMILTGVDEEWE